MRFAFASVLLVACGIVPAGTSRNESWVRSYGLQYGSPPPTVANYDVIVPDDILVGLAVSGGGSRGGKFRRGGDEGAGTPRHASAYSCHVVRFRWIPGDSILFAVATVAPMDRYARPETDLRHQLRSIFLG